MIHPNDDDNDDDGGDDDGGDNSEAPTCDMEIILNAGGRASRARHPTLADFRVAVGDSDVPFLATLMLLVVLLVVLLVLLLVVLLVLLESLGSLGSLGSVGLSLIHIYAPPRTGYRAYAV